MDGEPDISNRSRKIKNYKGLGIVRDHRVGLSAACGNGLSSLACRFVTGEEERKVYSMLQTGQSECLNKRMILAHTYTQMFTRMQPCWYAGLPSMSGDFVVMLYRHHDR